MIWLCFTIWVLIVGFMIAALVHFEDWFDSHEVAEYWFVFLLIGVCFPIVVAVCIFSFTLDHLDRR